MLAGYARVSTQDQKLELQRDALNTAGCEKIFEDKASGVKAARLGVAEAITFMRPGDTLVIWKLSRLGRTLKQLIETVQSLQDKDVELKSLHESIDTNTAMGKLLFHIVAAFAQFERDNMIENTTARLVSACARERRTGTYRHLMPRRWHSHWHCVRTLPCQSATSAKRLASARPLQGWRI
ncbi:MAG: recombinase family protein [Janthinobacterium lividum]